MATTQSPPLLCVPRVECAMCKVVGAKFVCATCGTFYCNVPCQVKHWPTHRSLCMPRLLMATSILGTSICLDQHASPVMPIPLSISNEKMNPPSMRAPNSLNVVPSLPTVPVRNDVVNTKKPANSKNKENIGSQQTVVASSATTMAKPLSNEGKAIQQKEQQPAMKSAKDANTKSSTVVAEQKVEKNGQKAVGAVMEKSSSLMDKPKQKKAEPVSKHANEINAKSTTAVCEQKVEKNGQKADGFVTPKPSSNILKPKQQKEEPVVEKVNSTNTKMSSNDGTRKESTAKNDPGKLLQYGAFPEPGSKVKISYVADDKIYIYETGPGPNGERNAVEMLFIRALECARSVKSHLSVPPLVHDIVFAGYDGEYYRAMVKSVENNMAEVFYPDFGNSQMVQWNTLKEIPDPKIKYANCLTHGVWIESIASFTQAIKEFLRQLENDATFMLLTVIDVQNSAGIKMVEMYHCSEKYHLSSKLLNIQGSCSNTKKQQPSPPKSPEKTSKFVVTNPNTYKPVHMNELIDAVCYEGKGMELMITNASNAFTENILCVMTKPTYTQYKIMIKECEMYGKIDPNPYEPKGNELCLVNKGGIWYRAVTIQSPGQNTVTVFLVDEGIIDDGVDSQIRRYPPGLTRHQFAIEYPTFLLDAIGGNEENVDTVCGKLIKADIYSSQDEDMCDTTHITILEIGK
uniref:MYND-type domain-containing protein n=1 Tax=Anopheles funestus TaxID=62324 RepID=A0A182R479_ANOFN